MKLAGGLVAVALLLAGGIPPAATSVTARVSCRPGPGTRGGLVEATAGLAR
jgi:hypothetical protein